MMASKSDPSREYVLEAYEYVKTGLYMEVFLLTTVVFFIHKYVDAPSGVVLPCKPRQSDLEALGRKETSREMWCFRVQAHFV